MFQPIVSASCGKMNHYSDVFAFCNYCFFPVFPTQTNEFDASATAPYLSMDTWKLVETVEGNGCTCNVLVKACFFNLVCQISYFFSTLKSSFKGSC